MKVRAIGDEIGVVVGYYDNRRIKAGQVFEIKSEKDMGKWMEKVEETAKSIEKPKEEPRVAVPIKDANKAVHEGKAEQPKKEEVKPTGNESVI